MPGAVHTSGAPRATPHVQASVSPNILGLNTVSPHESNVRQAPFLINGPGEGGGSRPAQLMLLFLSLPHQISPYVVGGQSSPSLQPQPAPLFPTPSCHTQQIFTITHSTQQVRSKLWGPSTTLRNLASA